MSEETVEIASSEHEFSNSEQQEALNNNQTPALKRGTENSDNDSSFDDDDDDFGNFSDASFEDDTIKTEEDIENEEEREQAQKFQCLETLFGPDPVSSSLKQDNVDIALDVLIEDERPCVIYEQLFNGRLHTSPFIWKHSHIRSAMLQVLGIKDDEEVKTRLAEQLAKEKANPLDDSLYIKLCQVVEADKNNNNGNTMILRDNFRYEYTPRFHQPGSTQEDQEKEEDIRVPMLLDWNKNVNESMTVEQLKKYHDELCNMIDLQAVKLKALNHVQDNLTHDKVTFENVVTNLSGHTQRLQRDEIALYNEKIGRKLTGHTNHRDSNQWKGFSWVGL